MAPDMVAATLALQHAPLATILDYYVYFPALIEPLWNHQAIMLGAWPLLLESGEASQSALRLHAYFPDGFAARDWLCPASAPVRQKGRVEEGRISGPS